MPKTSIETTAIVSNKVDWSVFKIALVVLISSVALSILCIVACDKYQENRQEWVQNQQRVLELAIREYRRYQEAIQIVDLQYYDDYNKLVAKGFFQSKPSPDVMRQHLLDLKEKFETIMRKANVTGKFESSTKDYTVTHIELEPDLKVHETDLNFTLELLHEGLVLKLWQGIEFRETKEGLFNLKSCDVTRADEVNTKSPQLKPYLKATCVLSWYTAERTNKEKK